MAAGRRWMVVMASSFDLGGNRGGTLPTGSVFRIFGTQKEQHPADRLTSDNCPHVT